MPDASWPNIPAVVHDHDIIEGRLKKVEGDVTFLARLAYVLIALIVALAGLFAIAMVSTPTASADPIVVYTNPLDIRYPDFRAGWCPGGGGGFIVYFCDGKPYADGTQWHWTSVEGVKCVIHTGDPMPPIAPTGGCGGIW